MRLITVERAKKEVEKLQYYISLVEDYEADTLEKWIIKEYAQTNSITKVVNRARIKGKELDRVLATSILTGKTTDELHKILKAGYKSRFKKKKSPLF